jgi:threonine/homoserine/homoserine lactone efflux protein
MGILSNGLFFGLALAFFIGPVFFALIQVSIEKGFKTGAAMAFGIFLSDLTYIVICYLGISRILESETLKVAMSLGGGSILLAFGISSFKKPALEKNQICSQSDHPVLWRYGIKGVMLNGINPFVILFWVAVASIAAVEFNYSGKQVILFFGTILLTVLATDLIKAYMAHRLGRYITIRNMTILNRVVGIALVAFALRLFYSGLAVSFFQF